MPVDNERFDVYFNQRSRQFMNACFKTDPNMRSMIEDARVQPDEVYLVGSTRDIRRKAADKLGSRAFFVTHGDDQYPNDQWIENDCLIERMTLKERYEYSKKFVQWYERNARFLGWPYPIKDVTRIVLHQQARWLTIDKPVTRV